MCWWLVRVRGFSWQEEGLELLCPIKFAMRVRVGDGVHRSTWFEQVCRESVKAWDLAWDLFAWFYVVVAKAVRCAELEGNTRQIADGY